LIAES